MLAFAIVSLVKVARREQLGEEKRGETLLILSRLTQSLQTLQLPQDSSHPHAGILKGLEQAMESFRGSFGQSIETVGGAGIDESILMDHLWNMDFDQFGGNWMGFEEN
jgi:hypothetical protein